MITCEACGIYFYSRTSERKTINHLCEECKRELNSWIISMDNAEIDINSYAIIPYDK